MKPFRQSPFLRILLFYMAGIFVQYRRDISSCEGYLFAFAWLLLFPFCFSTINRRYKLRTFFGGGVLLLSFVSAVYLTKKAWDASEWNISGFHTYLVRVVDEPVDKAKTRMCYGEILSTDSLAGNETVTKKVIFYLPKDSLSAKIVPGSCFSVRAFLEKPQPLPGDASFDYPLYLRKRSFAAVAFVRKTDWQPEPETIAPGRSIFFQALSFRRNLLSRLRIILPDTQSFALASALMFGYKGDLDKELKQRFSNIGAGHILAISGLHFSLIFGIAYFLLSFMGKSRKAKILKQLILLPVIWGFAFFTGLSPSVIRAAATLSFWGIGDAFFYKSFSLNTLAAVAFFMLIYNPLYLFDIGFQLSFLAVASILIVNPLIINLYSSKNKIIQYVWDMVAVSFSAQAGVLPLSLYYFHQFPLLFLLTNMLLIPLSGLIMALIPFSLLFSGMIGNYDWAFYPLRWTTSGFIALTDLLNDILGATITSIHLSAAVIFLIYAGLLAAVYLLLRKRTA